MAAAAVARTRGDNKTTKRILWAKVVVCGLTCFSKLVLQRLIVFKGTSEESSQLIDTDFYVHDMGHLYSLFFFFFFLA